MTDSPSSFSVGSCLEYAWNTFKTHTSGHVILTLVLFAASVVAQAAISFASRPLGSAAGMLLSGFFWGCLARAARTSSRGQAPTLDDAFTPLKERQGDYLVVGLAISAGVLACGIGLLVTWFLFMYAPVLVVDGRDFKQALIESKDLALKYPSDTALILLLAFALGLAGLLACGVGLLVTTPLTQLLVVRAYDVLSAQAGVLTADASPPPEASPPPAV
jgi:hypothetical protein